MSTRKAKKKTLTTAASEKIFKKFETQPEQLTQEEVHEINETMDDPSRGVWRRTALESLCQTGAQLIGAMKQRDTAAAFAEVCLCIDEDVKRLRGVAQLMENASLRIHLAMCQREDMFKLLEDARVALASQTENQGGDPILRLVVDNTRGH
jgi:hypothetical protein